MQRILAGLSLTVFGLLGIAAASADDLAAAVLPVSRSAAVGQTVTAFATVINTAGRALNGCAVSLPGFSGTFGYQTTNPATNAPTGTANASFSLATGGSQTFVIALKPSVALAPTDEHLVFQCSGSGPAPSIVGLNTLLLSAETTQPPDIVTLSATPTSDGVLRLNGVGAAQAFAVASVNVGVAAPITVSADTGDIALPLQIQVCQTNPTTGACLAAPAAAVSATIAANATPTFALFATAQAALPFFPATVRAFVRFKDAGGKTRGATSVALSSGSTIATGQTAGGFYRGLTRATSGAAVGATSAVQFIISEDGEMRGITTTSAASSDATALFSTTAIANNSLAYVGTGTLLAANGDILADGSTSSPLAVQGVVSPHNFIAGLYQTTPNLGEFKATYQSAIYERASSLAAVSGSWTLRDGNGNAAGTLTVTSGGTFAGSDLFGCHYAGSVALIDTRYNAYRIRLTVSNCGSLSAQYAGLAGLYDGRSANDSLEFALSSASLSETAFITRY
jgi:hypothetical protein